MTSCYSRLGALKSVSTWDTRATQPVWAILSGSYTYAVYLTPARYNLP